MNQSYIVEDYSQQHDTYFIAANVNGQAYDVVLNYNECQFNVQNFTAQESEAIDKKASESVVVLAEAITRLENYFKQNDQGTIGSESTEI